MGVEGAKLFVGFRNFNLLWSEERKTRKIGLNRSLMYEACPESKDTSRVGRYGKFYAYYGNTAVDLYPLPVSRARSTVVEPALFE